jgi:hypothetical protein
VVNQNFIRNLTIPTVLAMEATNGRASEKTFCAETNTIYKYVASGSKYNRDGLSILNTSNGGNTRWVAVSGKYAVSEDYIDLYKYTTTYAITGGGTALADSLTANGSGTADTPKVYEIQDDLNYNGAVLNGLSNIVIRGGEGYLPTINTTSINCFAITSTSGTETNITIGNLKMELSGDNKYGIYLWRQSGATTLLGDIYVKDVVINGNTIDGNTDSTGGVVVKDDTSYNGFWVRSLIVEGCFFNNISSRTDSGAIMTFGVKSYIGSKNAFTWGSIADGFCRNTYWHRCTNAKEVDGVFYGGILATSDSYRHYVKIAQDFAGNFNQPVTITLQNCSFVDNPNVNRAVISVNSLLDNTTTLNKLTLEVNGCSFVNCDGGAVMLRGDSVDRGKLISFIIKNNTFNNCKYGLIKDATFVSTLLKHVMLNNTFVSTEPLSNFSEIVNKGVTQYGYTYKLTEYAVTAGFVANEGINITTGAGATAGTSTVSGNTLASLPASFSTSKAIDVALNGIILKKGVSVSRVDASNFSVNLPLYVGDIVSVYTAN